MIGRNGERRSGISAQTARHDDDDVSPTGSRWMSNNYITPCHRQFKLVGVSVLEFELQFEAVRTSPQDPRLSSPAEGERSAAIVRGTWGQYVAVCSVSNSPLTHNPFATFRIKCERYIFLKNCVRSSLLLIMFLHIYVYV